MLISQGHVRASEWEAAIMQSLGDKAAEYEKVVSRVSDIVTADGHQGRNGPICWRSNDGVCKEKLQGSDKASGYM